MVKSSWLNPLPHRDAFSKLQTEQTQTRQLAAGSGSTLFAYGNMIRYDPTLVDLTSNFYVQAWKFIYIIIQSGWSLAWIFIKERVKWVKLLFSNSGHSTEHVRVCYVRVGTCGLQWTCWRDHSTGRWYGNSSGLWRYLYPLILFYIASTEKNIDRDCPRPDLEFAKLNCFRFDLICSNLLHFEGGIGGFLFFDRNSSFLKKKKKSCPHPWKMSKNFPKWCSSFPIS